MADLMSYAVTMIMWTMLVFVIGIFLMAIGVGALFLYRYMRFKIKLDIYEKVGGAYMGFGREAREVINKPDAEGKRHSFLHLRTPFKGYSKIPLPDSASYVPYASKLTGNKKKLNLLFKDTLFAPIAITENSDPAFNFNTKDLLYVLNSWDQDYSENLETHKAKPGFWDKYSQFITIISVLGMTMIFWIIIFVLTSGGGGGGAPQIIT